MGGGALEEATTPLTNIFVKCEIGDYVKKKIWHFVARMQKNIILHQNCVDEEQTKCCAKKEKTEMPAAAAAASSVFVFLFQFLLVDECDAINPVAAIWHSVLFML